MKINCFRKFPILLLVIMFLFFSCSDEILHFVPEQAPPQLQVPTNVKFSLVSTPPLIILDNDMPVLGNVPSQLFSITVLPVKDLTKSVEFMLEPLQEMIYTSLSKCERFHIIYDKSNSLQSEPARLDSNLIDKSAKEIYFKEEADGYLSTSLTTKSKINSRKGKVTIDYKLFSNNDKLLYSDVIKFEYYYNGNTKGLSIERVKINKIGSNLKNLFPQRELYDNVKVMQRTGDIIKLNSGYDRKLKPGLFGYVVRVDRGLEVESLSYRAKFQITEVFQESCNAKLIYLTREEEVIAATIRAGEPVVFK